jgi:hypothetical protein
VEQKLQSPQKSEHERAHTMSKAFVKESSDDEDDDGAGLPPIPPGAKTIYGHKAINAYVKSYCS